MSRSRKKPHITDQNAGKPGYGQSKRIANKAVRAEGKKAERGDESAELAKGKAYRRVSNPWDIRDWSFHDPKNPKAHRK